MGRKRYSNKLDDLLSDHVAPHVEVSWQLDTKFDGDYDLVVGGDPAVFGVVVHNHMTSRYPKVAFGDVGVFRGK